MSRHPVRERPVLRNQQDQPGPDLRIACYFAHNRCRKKNVEIYHNMSPLSTGQRIRKLAGMGKEHGDTGLNETEYNGRIELLHLNEPADLIRAIGKLHYLCAKEGYRVLFRGQTNLYSGSLLPSLFRDGSNASSQAEVHKREDALESYLRTAWKVEKREKYTDNSCLEPLLQHYGLRTRWLDVVDTIWPALWFATHTISFDSSELVSAAPSESEFAYIICLSFKPSPGVQVVKSSVIQGEDCHFVDLRTAVNSVFVRPHCQHGCLIRGTSGHDYWPLVQDVIRIPTRPALKWLGDGGMLRQSFMFPERDFGLRTLKRWVRKPAGVLGDGFC